MPRPINVRANWELDLMTRVMMAEAVNNPRALQMVGNVIANRVRANCFDFKGVRFIEQAIAQPHAFESYIFRRHVKQRPTAKHSRIARRSLRYQTHPAPQALWFYAPKPRACKQPNWLTKNQWFVGHYDGHCFYVANRADCPGAF